MPKLKLFFSVLTIIASIVSGLLWLAAAKAKVRKANVADPHFSAGGLTLTETGEKEDYDILATGKKQNFWNTWAAIFAAIAAFSQAAQAIVPE